MKWHRTPNFLLNYQQKKRTDKHKNVSQFLLRFSHENIWQLGPDQKVWNTKIVRKLQFDLITRLNYSGKNIFSYEYNEKQMTVNMNAAFRLVLGWSG